MREVEDSPNRCPECQRVQLDTQLCQDCAAKGLITVQTDSFVRSSHDQDLLDILDILDWINDQQTDMAGRAISTMRESVSQRRIG